MRRNALLFIAIICVTFFSAHGDDISVSLNPKTATLNDTFTATFSTSKQLNGEPDFSPLEEDFDILSQNQEFSTSIVNGAFSQQKRWKLVLAPKKEGALVIPPIHFGTYESNPQPILVTKGAAAAKHDSPLFLEAEISPAASAYEQTVLIYTVRLYSAIRIMQGSLSEPKTNDPEAIIERLGQDAEFDHQASNGKRYRVIERKYTIVPQRAGELVVSPVQFDGQASAGMNSFFDMQMQYKRAASNTCQLEIKPIPAPFQRSDWLAATNLILSEEWSSDPSKITVGEPITWTLKIIADGCFGNQIPEPSFHLPAQLKQYKDKPETSTEETPYGLRGTKQIKIALISSVPGEVPLPEIVIKWWDLETDELKQARLPEKTLQIEREILAMAPAIPQSPQPVQMEPVMQAADALQNKQSLPVWVWTLLAINGSAVAGACYYLLRRLSFKLPRRPSTEAPLTALKRACARHDAKETEAALLVWAKKQFPDAKIHNLASFKPLVPAALFDDIHNLQQVLYGSAPIWNGESLWENIKAFKPRKEPKEKTKQKDNLLKELYPS